MAQILENHEEEPPHSPQLFRPTRRRASSFSSSSPSSSHHSSSSYSDNHSTPLFSPNSTPLKFKGIPFSWEQIPGIPKHQFSKKKDSSGHLLPLPPAGTTSSAASKKLLLHDEISPKKNNKFESDPFFAALVECSKDDHHQHGSKITRTLSDRFGFINMYSSCKRTCAVSESVVYIPRQTPHYLLSRRSS